MLIVYPHMKKEPSKAASVIVVCESCGILLVELTVQCYICLPSSEGKHHFIIIHDQCLIFPQILEKQAEWKQVTNMVPYSSGHFGLTRAALPACHISCLSTAAPTVHIHTALTFGKSREHIALSLKEIYNRAILTQGPAFEFYLWTG